MVCQIRNLTIKTALETIETMEPQQISPHPPPSSTPVNTGKPWMMWILLVVVIAVLSSVATVITMTATQQQTPPNPETKACTEDGRICPDGAHVGRVPPSCDFAACPDVVASPSASPTSNPTQPVVKLLPTTGWVETGNSTFTIKYPADKYEPTITEKGIGLKIKGTASTYGPAFAIADTYTGGSRREWYLQYYSYTQEDVNKNVFFTDKQLGPNNVLEVRLINESIPRNIVYSSGNTLIDVAIQSTDITLVETIVSTLKLR